MRPILLYRDENELAETCSQTGVLAPLLAIVGGVQAVEAIKLLTGLWEPLVGRLLLLDAARMEWRTVRLRKDPACPVCGVDPAATLHGLAAAPSP